VYQHSHFTCILLLVLLKVICLSAGILQQGTISASLLLDSLMKSVFWCLLGICRLIKSNVFICYTQFFQASLARWPSVGTAVWYWRFIWGFSYRHCNIWPQSVHNICYLNVRLPELASCERKGKPHNNSNMHETSHILSKKTELRLGRMMMAHSAK